MIPFEYTKPLSTGAAISAVGGKPDVQFIAGGTNLVDLMKKGVTTPQKLVDINGLPLKDISFNNGVLRIGALALNSIVAEHPLVREKAPLVSEALKAGASPQIRNIATMGGNLMQRTRCPYFYDTAMPCNKRVPGTGCSALQGYNRMHAILGASEQCIAVHPSDLCVGLAALDTQVIVSGAKGERKIPFLDFHRLPGNTPHFDNNLKGGELITALEIKETSGSSPAASYTKVRDRHSYAFALVSVALHAMPSAAGAPMRGIRIALGGVAHKPWRATAAERLLEGKLPAINAFEEAAAATLKEAKGYQYNQFKIKLAAHTLVHALGQHFKLS